MKKLLLLMLVSTLVLAGEKCDLQRSAFERAEKAHDVVTEIAVASNSAYVIIGDFIKKGTTFLKECPKSYSLDRQYTLKRKLKKARSYQQSFKVFTQEQVRRYAISHPEEQVIYKWGKIRVLR